jgi:hypothetical protein
MEKHPLQPSRSSLTPSQDPLDSAKQNELNIDKPQAKVEPLPVVDHTIAQSRVKQRKGHKALFVGLLIVVLVVAAAGYYFLMR